VTSIAVKDIGFCAHFSRQGDWAFEFALALARRLEHRLNIFYFPDLDPSVSNRPPGGWDEDELIALDRRVREYYDEKLGDFVEAGFRVCEDFIDTELRRCLFRREYQVMVLGYLRPGARFGDDSIGVFAYRFNGPVVLVGPDRPDQLHLNPPARLVAWRLGLAEGDWTPLPAPAEVGARR
jgi:hypothetical protein